MIRIEKKCSVCGSDHFIMVREEDFNKWHSGYSIQEAMPYLSAGAREILLSGICSECFDSLFTEEDWMR